MSEMPPGPKYTAALAAAYGAGLRIAEVAALKVSDVSRTSSEITGPCGAVPTPAT